MQTVIVSVSSVGAIYCHLETFFCHVSRDELVGCVFGDLFYVVDRDFVAAARCGSEDASDHIVT